MKRRLASRQLTGLAMNQWETIIANTPEEEITWEQFKERFEGKFVPKAQKDMLFRKFADLTQGNRTVIEYVNEFDALSKYGMTLADTKEKKSEKFVSGLNDYLGSHLLNHVKEPMHNCLTWL